MSNYNESVISLNKPTLALTNIRAIIFIILLTAAAVILPLVTHLSGAPVRFLLPMHWPVILAGLVYGWRAGLLTGLLAPIVSYFLSGLPPLSILPSMTMELMTYGLVTGLFREVLRFNPFISVAIALVLGRIVFITSVLLSSIVITNYAAYFSATLLPGIIAAFLQIALLPTFAKWWIRHDGHISRK